MLELSCTLKNDLGFLNTYDEIWIVCDSFSMFLIFQLIFYFQGSHIWAIEAIQKHMAPLKMKSDPVLSLRNSKTY